MDEKLDMTQQCVLTAWETNCILGYIKNIMVSSSREMILPLWCVQL